MYTLKSREELRHAIEKRTFKLMLNQPVELEIYEEILNALYKCWKEIDELGIVDDYEDDPLVEISTVLRNLNDYENIDEEVDILIGEFHMFCDDFGVGRER